MIGERKNIYPDTNYGTLTMRDLGINGNKINAFYDAEDNLVFVLDNTINAQKPNVLLVINPDGDKKWDEILANDYGLDLETIRPKVDNKYQKLDIEYSGLPVYEKLIKAYDAGDDLQEELNQLAVLRDSATRHSAMMRLNVANETISKTNITIVKTKETIVRLDSRIKNLRSNLSAEKKKIGKVNTKQSASKILKLESQIEATNEKLKRAKKRLESAQKRLEAATVEAELASALLNNQPAIEIKEPVKNKSIAVAPLYPVQKTEEDADTDEVDDDIDDEEMQESGIQPLFSEDPQILNNDIAFKPIEFNAPVFEDVKQEQYVEPVLESVHAEEKEPDLESRPVLESFKPIETPDFIPEPITEEKIEIREPTEERPVLETMTPVVQEATYVEPINQEEPKEETNKTQSVPVAPMAPMVNTFQTPTEAKSEHSKPGFIYYVLLLLLIVLSVFTLWLYQKNMVKDTTPILTASAPETTVMQPKQKTTEPDANSTVVDESVFLDETNDESNLVLDKETVVEQPEIKYDEEIIEQPDVKDAPVVYDEEIIEEPDVEDAPVVIDVVPSRLNTSISEEETHSVASEEDILANKPAFEPGAKHDNMFVNDNGDFVETDAQEPGFIDPEEYDAHLYREEDALYQAEMQQ